jgi:PAS domain S-box-containing protein
MKTASDSSVRREVTRYGVAVGAVVVATVARLALDGIVGSGVLFVTFYPTVAVVAMASGGRAGLTATLLSAGAAVWFLIEPRISLGLASETDLVSLLCFIGAGLVMSATAAMLSRERLKERRAAEQLETDLDATRRLQKVGALFVAEGNLVSVLGEIVETAIAISRADFGTIQVLKDGGTGLQISAQRGFPDWWVDFWNQGSGTPGTCGAALECGERVIVEDVERSPIFAGTRALEMQLKAGVRAVQSTPLLSRAGKLVGIFSTHWRRPGRPDERVLRLLDLLARQTADIIERAQTDEALKAKQAELELILRSTPFMLTRCSRDLRYLYASRAYAEMLGRSQEEIAGRSIAEVMGQKGFATIKQNVEAVLRGERVEYEGDIEFEGVGTRRLIVAYVPELDEGGDVIGWIASIIDMTGQRRAEKALAETQARLALALEAAGGAMWGWNIPENRLDEWDAMYRKLFGFSGQESPRIETWLARLHPEDRQRLGKRLEQMLRTPGDDIWDEQFRILHPERGERWLFGLGKCSRDGAGEVLRMTGVCMDITERREAQEVLKRSKEELTALVAERTAKLQELVGELEHFSYTITHDMRAPLRAMRGFAEAVNELAVGSPDGKQKEFLERIITAAERMDALIVDALSYSKAVRQELLLSPVDVAKLVRGMLDTYPEFQRTRAEITVERNIPLVMGNEAGLTQCFSNLLGNAVKFVEPGKKAVVRVWGEALAGSHLAHGHEADGHQVDSHQANGHRVDDRDGDGWVRLWVEDRGTGISEDMLPRVFDMFSRGSNPQAGTGIGLALVRKVVGRMGGRVGVESEIGKGSRFWLELRGSDVRRARAEMEEALTGVH